MFMKSQFPACAGLMLGMLALLAFTATPLQAEVVFVTSMIGTATNDIGACPPSCTTGAVSSHGSTAISMAVPMPAGARKARYGYADGCAWNVTPTNITQTSSSGTTWTCQSLQPTWWYRISITKGTSMNCSSNLVVTLTVDAATTLRDLNNNEATSLCLDQFQAAQPNNVWIQVGFISSTTPNPTVTFAWASGTLSSTDRWYMDAVRFDSLCCNPATPARITEILYGNPITISGTGPVGHPFALVSSTNAANALNLWTPEQISTVSTGSFTFSVTAGTENARFFRVITQ